MPLFFSDTGKFFFYGFMEFINSKPWELQLLGGESPCVCVFVCADDGGSLERGKQGAEELTSEKGSFSTLNYQQFLRAKRCSSVASFPVLQSPNPHH